MDGAETRVLGEAICDSTITMSTPTTEPNAALENLAALLRRRIEIIADHTWRDADPAAHLEALKAVSLQIGARHASVAAQLPARLNHFFTQCSFDKALEFIETKP